MNNTVTKTLNLADRYEARFGNLDEIMLPCFMLESAFLELLKNALDRGLPLTRPEVEKIFPDPSWEW